MPETTFPVESRASMRSERESTLPLATLVALVKHGQTTDNARGVHQGRGRDGGLTADGVRQCRLLAHHLECLDQPRILTSPMLRCRETTRELIAARGWRARIEEESLLLPKASGSLSGHPRDLIQRRAAEAGVTVAEYREPGGESTHDVMHRASEAWRRWITPYGIRHDVVLVSHGDVLACLLLHLCELDYDAFLQAVMKPGEAVIFPAAQPPRSLDELRAAKRTGTTEDAA